jgi:riboflavin biosynthesis pyrimidine reductase
LFPKRVILDVQKDMEQSKQVFDKQVKHILIALTAKATFTRIHNDINAKYATSNAVKHAALIS